MSNDQILNYLKNRLFDEIKNRLIKNINILKKLKFKFLNDLNL